MANCVPFKAIALLALIGAVVLFCDAKPTLKPPYKPSDVVIVGQKLLGRPSYTYDIKYTSKKANSVETVFVKNSIRYIRISQSGGNVRVNVLNEDHNKFKMVKNNQETNREWKVTFVNL